MKAYKIKIINDISENMRIFLTAKHHKMLVQVLNEDPLEVKHTFKSKMHARMASRDAIKYLMHKNGLEEGKDYELEVYD